MRKVPEHLTSPPCGSHRFYNTLRYSSILRHFLSLLFLLPYGTLVPYSSSLLYKNAISVRHCENEKKIFQVTTVLNGSSLGSKKWQASDRILGGSFCERSHGSLLYAKGTCRRHTPVNTACAMYFKIKEISAAICPLTSLLLYEIYY